MTYEQKLQVRANEIESLIDNSGLGKQDTYRALAALSLQWSAEDFKAGWREYGINESCKEMKFPTTTIAAQLIANGLKPQTDGE